MAAQELHQGGLARTSFSGNPECATGAAEPSYKVLILILLENPFESIGVSRFYLNLSRFDLREVQALQKYVYISRRSCSSNKVCQQF
jgi:hypothetical protein